MLKESLLAWGQEDKSSTSKIWLDKQVVYMRGGMSGNKNRVYMVNFDHSYTDKYFDLVYTTEYPKGDNEYFYTDKQTQALIRVATKKESTYLRTVYFQMFDPNTGALLDQHKITGYTINADDFLTFVNAKDGLYTAYFTGTYPGTTGVIQKEKHRVFVYMPKYKKMYEIEIPNGVITETAAQIVISVSDVSKSCIYMIENVADEDEKPIFHFSIGHYFYDGFSYKDATFEYNTTTNNLWYNIQSSTYAGMGTPGRVEVKYFDFFPTTGARWNTPVQFSTEVPCGVAAIGDRNFIITMNSQRKIIYSNDCGISWNSPIDSGITDTSFTASCGIYSTSPSSGYYFISENGKIAKTTSAVSANSYSLIDPIPKNDTMWKTVAQDGANGNIVVLSTSGYYAINSNITNGSTWNIGRSTELASKSLWYSIVNLNKGNYSYKFIALNATGYISFSNDGINWTTPVDVLGSSYSTWCAMSLTENGILVAISMSGYTAASTDGIHWSSPVIHTSMNLSSNNAYWRGLVYCGMLSSLVAITGTQGYVSISSASKDHAGLIWQKYESNSNYTYSYLMTLYYSISMEYSRNNYPSSKLGYVRISDAISRNYIGSNETGLYYEPITFGGVWYGNMTWVTPLYRESYNPTATTVNVYSTSGSIPSLEFYEGPKYYFRYPATSIYRNFLTSTLMYNSANYTLKLIDHNNQLKDVIAYDVRTGAAVTTFQTGIGNNRFPSTDKHFVVGAFGTTVSSSNPYRYVSVIGYTVDNNDTLSTSLTLLRIDCNTNSQMVADYSSGYAADNQFYPIAIGDGDVKLYWKTSSNTPTEIEIPVDGVYRLTLIGAGEGSQRLATKNSTSGIYSAFNMVGGSGSAIQVDIRLNSKYGYLYQGGNTNNWSSSTHIDATDASFSWVSEDGVTHTITTGSGKWGTVNRASDGSITSITGLQGGTISTSGSLDIERTIVWSNGNNGVSQYSNTYGDVLPEIEGISPSIDPSSYYYSNVPFGTSSSISSITNNSTSSSGSTYRGYGGYIQLEFLHY